MLLCLLYFLSCTCVVVCCCLIDWCCIVVAHCVAAAVSGLLCLYALVSQLQVVAFVVGLLVFHSCCCVIVAFVIVVLLYLFSRYFGCCLLCLFFRCCCCVVVVAVWPALIHGKRWHQASRTDEIINKLMGLRLARLWLCFLFCHPCQASWCQHL